MRSSFVFLSLFGSSIASSSVDFSHLFKRLSSGCSTLGAASCHNTSAVNTCCTEYPGGLLLQTQFWDTNVPGSPADSWTIHGLWPDNCDGTYTTNCDPSRDYSNITELLISQGATSTLDYMQQYWLNDAGTSEQLWEHEWATHGTCYSTLKPSCLPAGSPQGAEAVAFFETVVKLFQTLPTYTWLAAAGITPSTTQTHTLTSILTALKTGSGGYTPAVGCSSSKLSTISWYFNLKGSVIDGQFIPINSPLSSSCPSTGILFPPKTG
ncbi:ribonuclease T2 [Melanogaster broomeanus]|nr:ribonuclease T2 [Melanogaster broomeanus]